MCLVADSIFYCPGKMYKNVAGMDGMDGIGDSAVEIPCLTLAGWMRFSNTRHTVVVS